MMMVGLQLWYVDGNLAMLQENVGCSAGVCHPVSALLHEPQENQRP